MSLQNFIACALSSINKRNDASFSILTWLGGLHRDSRCPLVLVKTCLLALKLHLDGNGQIFLIEALMKFARSFFHIHRVGQLVHWLDSLFVKLDSLFDGFYIELEVFLSRWMALEIDSLFSQTILSIQITCFQLYSILTNIGVEG